MMVDISEQQSVNIRSREQQEDGMSSLHFFPSSDEKALYKGEVTTLAAWVTLPSETNSLEDSELAIKCCLPPFRRLNSDQWFIQVEKFFNVYGVQSDLLRYNMVICKLDSKTIQEIGDFLRSPPTSNKYDRLKSAIIKKLSNFVNKNPNSVDHQLHEHDEQHEHMQFKLDDKRLSPINDERYQLDDNRVPEHVTEMKAMHEQPSSSAIFSSNHCEPKSQVRFHPNLTAQKQNLIHPQNRCQNQLQNPLQNSQQNCSLIRSPSSSQSNQPCRVPIQPQNPLQNSQQNCSLIRSPSSSQSNQPRRVPIQPQNLSQNSQQHRSLNLLQDPSQYCFKGQTSDETLHKDLEIKHVEEQTQKFTTANNNEPGIHLNELTKNLSSSRVKKLKKDIFIRLSTLNIFDKLINKKMK